MAKDTEKLIRQLSLIAYLMAERRPVTATEIRRDVEGYSDMTEDAFARRFYADRSELDGLGIRLTVDRPIDGLSEQENYSLAPESFFLPDIAFTDEEHAALQTALSLLDGEFAYAEPLRLALQQIAWGRPSPLGSPAQRSLGLAITASAGGSELSSRLAKVDTAIYRRKRIEFEYYTMQTDSTELRRVDPYQLLFEGGQFYLVGLSHERGGIRKFRLSRIRGRVAYATKAEHDFQRPTDFDPRAYVNQIAWQLGTELGTAEVWVSDRVAWWVERNFGAYGTLEPAEGGGRIFRTGYAVPRLLLGWVLHLGEQARLLAPAPLVEELHRRLDETVALHSGEPELAPVRPDEPEADAGDEEAAAAAPRPRPRSEASIRPERFARLVTLATHLIAAGRAGERLKAKAVCARLQITPQELREDIAVLNIVNFGGGAYVLYAEVLPDGTIEVDPEPYSDTFDRPVRLLPIEAHALLAAIDLIGAHHYPGLESAQHKVEAALGEDAVRDRLLVTHATGDDPGLARVINRAIADRRALRIEYYSTTEDRFTERRIEPYALFNGNEAWYVAAVDPVKEDLRHFRLDRVKTVTVLEETFERDPDLNPIADIEGWPRTGEIEDSRTAHVWISPAQARWAREERTVLSELEDGAVIVSWTYKGLSFLVKDVLKEAGDAAIVHPEDAREAVRVAAEQLLAPAR